MITNLPAAQLDESRDLRRALLETTIATAGWYIVGNEPEPRELAYVLGLVERVALELGDL
jgi:hypothetical protein